MITSVCLCKIACGDGQTSHLAHFLAHFAVNAPWAVNSYKTGNFLPLFLTGWVDKTACVEYNQAMRNFSGNILAKNNVHKFDINVYTESIKRKKDGKNMALLQEWRDKAYSQQTDKKVMEAFWKEYFEYEKGVYEKLLENPDETVTGTVKELAEKYELPLEIMVGFLDGINDSLKEANPIEEMEEDTVVNLGFDKESLYKNMVDAKADWLYNLPQWNAIFDEEKRHALYLEAKKMNTIVKPKKVGRNDPCPCGSGKKFKQCHGRDGSNFYVADQA